MTTERLISNFNAKSQEQPSPAGQTGIVGGPSLGPYKVASPNEAPSAPQPPHALAQGAGSGVAAIAGHALEENPLPPVGEVPQWTKRGGMGGMRVKGALAMLGTWAAGLGVGAAVGFVISNPLGWIVGGVIGGVVGIALAPAVRAAARRLVLSRHGVAISDLPRIREWAQHSAEAFERFEQRGFAADKATYERYESFRPSGWRRLFRTEQNVRNRLLRLRRVGSPEDRKTIRTLLLLLVRAGASDRKGLFDCRDRLETAVASGKLGSARLEQMLETMLGVAAETLKKNSDAPVRPDAVAHDPAEVPQRPGADAPDDSDAPDKAGSLFDIVDVELSQDDPGVVAAEGERERLGEAARKMAARGHITEAVMAHLPADTLAGMADVSEDIASKAMQALDPKTLAEVLAPPPGFKGPEELLAFRKIMVIRAAAEKPGLNAEQNQQRIHRLRDAMIAARAYGDLDKERLLRMPEDLLHMEKPEVPKPPRYDYGDPRAEQAEKDRKQRISDYAERCWRDSTRIAVSVAESDGDLFFPEIVETWADAKERMYRPDVTRDPSMIAAALALENPAEVFRASSREAHDRRKTVRRILTMRITIGERPADTREVQPHFTTPGGYRFAESHLQGLKHAIAERQEPPNLNYYLPAALRASEIAARAADRSTGEGHYFITDAVGRLWKDGARPRAFEIKNLVMAQPPENLAWFLRGSRSLKGGNELEEFRDLLVLRGLLRGREQDSDTMQRYRTQILKDVEEDKSLSELRRQTIAKEIYEDFTEYNTHDKGLY